MERAHDAAKFGRLPERADAGGDDPVAGRPVAGRRRGARDARHERHRPGRAAHAPRAGPGTTRARRSATSSSRRSTTTRPGLARLVTARQVITPLDLERDYGLTGGHPMHGEHGLDQFFLWRPLLGHARYRLALDGLYLAGAGAHPGGGVTGQNGQNAAREIVGDLRAPAPLDGQRRGARAEPAAGRGVRSRSRSDTRRRAGSTMRGWSGDAAAGDRLAVRDAARLVDRDRGRPGHAHALRRRPTVPAEEVVGHDPDDLRVGRGELGRVDARSRPAGPRTWRTGRPAGPRVTADRGAPPGPRRARRRSRPRRHPARA